ncbi:MAG: hypothetical protein J6V45_02175 [Kiritimatiellae bacterium]|nr:hypothetical protein [Kiritimatiellia bacterium]
MARSFCVNFFIIFKMRILIILFLLISCRFLMALPLERQEFSLVYGWNAIYMQVQPQKPVEEVFADWPVKSVGFYDPSSFLSTRQFSAEWDSGNLMLPPIMMWHRDYPEASEIKYIPSGSVCILFSTNSIKTTVSVTGVPAAPRQTWHITDTNEVYNFVGFSLQKGQRVTPQDYLEGFLENVQQGGFFKLSGRNEQKSPTLMSLYQSDTFSDGDVLLAASRIQSNWSGVLNVSPMNGLNFGTDLVQQTLAIRNDGTAPRTVAIDIVDGILETGQKLRPSYLHTRDADVALTNAVWASCADGQTRLAQKFLASGETWRFQIGLDRKALAGIQRGISLGAILRITDVDGKSKMRVDVPMIAETSGDVDASQWPAGLWVADVAFNQIKSPGDTHETETGGEMKVRLPIHIDANGTARLLQRVVVAGETNEDGAFDYRLYAGSAAIPQSAKTVMRISAVTLPTETPVIVGQGGFSDKAVFEFIVSSGGSTSLLRHPLHPRHDGLDWDFKTAAPSGDNINNYKYDKKPETFSVQNKIELNLDMNGGEASWNPEKTKSGTVKWTLNGLRHEGAITISGKMTLKHVSPKGNVVLE